MSEDDKSIRPEIVAAGIRGASLAQAQVAASRPSFGGAAGSGAAMPAQNSEAPAKDHFSRPKPPGVK